MKEHKTFVPYSFLFTEQKQFCSGGCSCLRKLGLEVILREHLKLRYYFLLFLVKRSNFDSFLPYLGMRGVGPHYHKKLKKAFILPIPISG